MKKLRKKLIILVGAILIALTALFGKALHDPHTNLTMMSAGVDLGSGFCKYTKNFYIIVLCTEDIEEFNGTKYVIILRNDTETKVDLLRGEGVENVVSLFGNSALNYLESKELDLTSFDKEWMVNHHK